MLNLRNEARYQVSDRKVNTVSSMDLSQLQSSPQISIHLSPHVPICGFPRRSLTKGNKFNKWDDSAGFLDRALALARPAGQTRMMSAAAAKEFCSSSRISLRVSRHRISATRRSDLNFRRPEEIDCLTFIAIVWPTSRPYEFCTPSRLVHLS